MFKRFVAVLGLLVVLVACFVFPASAATLTNDREVEEERDIELTGFIPDGYSYYFCHQWDSNDDYYIGFYKSVPIMEKRTHIFGGISYYKMFESDGSNPLYYRFDTYDDMIAYLVLNDASNVDYVYDRNYIEHMYINLSSERMLYSNFDVAFSDGDLYYSKNAYTEKETVMVKGDKTYVVDTFDAKYFSDNILVEIIGILPVALSVAFMYLALRSGLRFLFSFLRNS